MIDELSMITRSLKARYDRKALQWGAVWPEGYDITAVTHVEQILERLANPQPADIALDIGTGRRARYFDRIRRRVAMSVGMDIAVAALSTAKDHLLRASCDGIPMFAAGSAAAMPFCDSSFSLVICSEVMEYYPRQSVVLLLKEIRRVLLPRGRLIVDFPDHTDPAAWAIRKTEQEDGVSFFIYEGSWIRSIIAETAFRVTATAKADCEVVYVLSPRMEYIEEPRL